MINLAAQSSPTGLKKETAAALSYVLLIVTGVFFLLMERNPFVRFHAMQSIVFSIVVFVVNTILGIIPVINFIVPLLMLAEFALWLMLIYQASQGVEWELPVIGKYARKFL